MSDAQLNKVREEKAQLENELTALQNAMAAKEASSKLMEYVASKPDPLLAPPKHTHTCEARHPGLTRWYSAPARPAKLEPVCVCVCVCVPATLISQPNTQPFWEHFYENKYRTYALGKGTSLLREKRPMPGKHCTEVQVLKRITQAAATNSWPSKSLEDSDKEDAY